MTILVNRINIKYLSYDVTEGGEAVPIKKTIHHFPEKLHLLTKQFCIMKSWYAVYTKEGSEQRVAGQLLQKKIEAYLPVRSMNSDKKGKKIKNGEPLIKSVVFLKSTVGEHTELLKVDGVINMLYWLGSPVQISDHDMSLLQDFVLKHKTINIEKIPVHYGEPAKFMMDPFMDGGKQLSRVRNVKLVMPSIGYTLSAGVKAGTIQIITQQNESSDIFQNYRQAN